jgi:hypothetical protein
VHDRRAGRLVGEEVLVRCARSRGCDVLSQVRN